MICKHLQASIYNEYQKTYYMIHVILLKLAIEPYVEKETP